MSLGTLKPQPFGAFTILILFFCFTYFTLTIEVFMTERIVSKHRSEACYSRGDRKQINFSKYHKAACIRYYRASRRLTKLTLKQYR